MIPQLEYLETCLFQELSQLNGFVTTEVAIVIIIVSPLFLVHGNGNDDMPPWNQEILSLSNQGCIAFHMLDHIKQTHGAELLSHRRNIPQNDPNGGALQYAIRPGIRTP